MNEKVHIVHIPHFGVYMGKGNLGVILINHLNSQHSENLKGIK